MAQMELNNQSGNIPRNPTARIMTYVDPIERRRVQNRIAQRSYRRRLKESQKLTKWKAAKENDSSAKDSDTRSDHSSNDDGSVTYNSAEINNIDSNNHGKVSTHNMSSTSGSTSRGYPSNPAPDRFQTRQYASMSSGREAWSSNSPDAALESLQIKNQLQHQPQKSQNFLERREDYDPQLSDRGPAGVEHQPLRLVRPVFHRPSVQPGGTQDVSSFLRDQMAISSDWVGLQVMGKQDHNLYPRHAGSQSPGQAPPPYLTPYSSTGVSSFETLIEPDLADYLPANDVNVQANDSQKQANRRRGIIQEGNTNVEIPDAVSYVSEYPLGPGLDNEYPYSERATAILYRGTALHRAAFYGRESVVVTLVQAGANFEARTCMGRTPLHLAAQNGQLAIVKILLELHVYHPQHHRRQDADRQFIPQSPDLNVMDDQGFTPLHLASERGHQGVVRLLVEYGADLEQRDSKGLTALNHASSDGRESAVKLLLEMGANVLG